MSSTLLSCKAIILHMEERQQALGDAAAFAIISWGVLAMIPFLENKNLAPYAIMVGIAWLIFTRFIPLNWDGIKIQQPIWSVFSKYMPLDAAAFLA
ncbi:MAG: hypothetical protein EB059_05105 [Alphaproteobacteria bacterium]|nr:hypothetical protein [Alphaproteobacteria bacterium]